MTTPAPATTDWVPIWNLAAPVQAGAMQVISDVLLAGTQATIDFQNIPQTFTHLRLSLFGRIDAAVWTRSVGMQFNGDAGSNYDYELVQGFGTTVQAGETIGTTMMQPGEVCGASATAGWGSGFAIDIPNYAGPFTKQVLSMAGARVSAGAGGYFASMRAGYWRNTAAVNRITLFPNGGGNFIAGTRATLYGLGSTNLSPSVASAATVATSLPTSPFDGQQVILTDSVSAPTFNWLLQWSASAARWNFIGGSPLQYVKPPPSTPSTAAAVDTIASAYPTYAQLPTTGNVGLTVPRTGLYNVVLGMRSDNTSDGSQTMLSYKRGATAPVDADAVNHRILNWADIYREYPSNFTAGQYLQLMACSTSPGAGSRIFYIVFKLTPVWVT